MIQVNQNPGRPGFQSTTKDTSVAQGGCSSPVVFTLVMLWVAFLSYARQLIVLAASGTPGPATDRVGMYMTLGLAFLLSLPVVPLAIFWRDPQYRPIFRAWAAAVVFMLLLVPAQLPDVAAEQVRALLQIGLNLAFITGVLMLSAREAYRLPIPSGLGLPSAFLLGGIFLLPWFAWGALGSPLDTLLHILTALTFAIAASLVLARLLIGPVVASKTDQGTVLTRRNNLLLALGSSLTLLIMAAGTAYPFGGMQVLLMLLLAAAGWLAPAFRRLTALALLIGLAAVGPIAFIDGDELALVITLASGEIMQWALQSVLISGSIALLLGLALAAFPPIQHKISGSLSVGLAVLAWIAGAVIYFTLGQPGFFGEYSFVILEDRADLSGAQQAGDYNARRSYVYETLTRQAAGSQAGLREILDRYHLDYTPFYLENAIEVRIEPLLQFWLENQPGVDRVLASPHLRPLPAAPPISRGTALPPSGTPWNLSLIHADKVWSELGVTGEGIIIGQSDSGAWATHPELAGSYRGREGGPDYNWYDPWYGRTEPYDIGGHGTHTLGTIVGQNIGVAPGATWYGCVNLARNLGNPALYLRCMQYMLAPFPQGGDPFTQGRPDLGAHVINNSWGCPSLEGCDPNALRPAVDALRQAGVFVEVSAGNDGPSCGSLNTAPAFYSEAFATGAIDQNGELAFFSSRGPIPYLDNRVVKPDLVAPGVEVLSAFPQDSYSTASGTSMAGPHTVGVVALMWSANPDLIGDIDRTEEILHASTQPYAGNLPACTGADASPSTAVGYGILDAYQAVRMAQQAQSAFP